ncbi:lipoyl synthase [Candidatus Fermentibacteria bacterium]|nr:lipoyl synthase [Candidatus Fermentibacteria bacterium]
MSEMRRPSWLKRPIGKDPEFFALRRMVRASGLATVCESASCPNLGECWSRGFLTVMILGDTCTRACRFCGVAHGTPGPLDREEPIRVAKLLAGLNLRYVVLTSVDRDDLPDGGSGLWAATIHAVRTACPEVYVEALISDFGGATPALDRVIEAWPDVLSHNVETVESLQRTVRPQASYRRSLGVLERAAARGCVTKSGLMVGLGETMEEVTQTLRDLAATGVKMVTVGQYLRPSAACLPVARYWPPEEFDEIRKTAVSLGLDAQAGPLVRSSYQADLRVRGSAA